MVRLAAAWAADVLAAAAFGAAGLWLGAKAAAVVFAKVAPTQAGACGPGVGILANVAAIQTGACGLGKGAMALAASGGMALASAALLAASLVALRNALVLPGG